MARILIARFHSLGDVVLATGIAQRLADGGDEVEVATSERYLPVFEGMPVARVWTPDRLSEAGRFDRVVDLQANASSRRVLRGLGPARRVRSRALARRWIVVWGRRPPAPRIPHVVQRYAEAAGCDEPIASRLRPRLSVCDRDREEARALPLAWSATEGECVALAAGGSRPLKRWPEARFEALSGVLASRGIRSVRFVEPIDGSGEGPGVVRATLRPLKALLARCGALVTNDSGVMHMGVGLGIPVIALFGSTVREFGFAPLGDRDQVLERDLACRPCAAHGARFCWQGHGRCLKGITVDEVLSSILARIDGRGSC